MFGLKHVPEVDFAKISVFLKARFNSHSLDSATPVKKFHCSIKVSFVNSEDPPSEDSVKKINHDATNDGILLNTIQDNHRISLVNTEIFAGISDDFHDTIRSAVSEEESVSAEKVRDSKEKIAERKERDREEEREEKPDGSEVGNKDEHATIGSKRSMLSLLASDETKKQKLIEVPHCDTCFVEFDENYKYPLEQCTPSRSDRCVACHKLLSLTKEGDERKGMIYWMLTRVLPANIKPPTLPDQKSNAD